MHSVLQETGQDPVPCYQIHDKQPRYTEHICKSQEQPHARQRGSSLTNSLVRVATSEDPGKSYYIPRDHFKLQRTLSLAVTVIVI